MKKSTIGIVVSVVSLLCILTTALLFYFFSTPTRVLTQKTFQDIPNWQHDNHSKALFAFKRSCNAWINHPPSDYQSLTSTDTVSNWQRVCKQAAVIPENNPHQARRFFEKQFTPYAVSTTFQNQGLFTGYYLPLLHVAKSKDATYRFPIYAMPTNLIKVDLGLFVDALHDKRIVGQVDKNTLIPYFDRQQIENGSLENKAEVIAWCDNQVDLFFAHIQGSAILQFPDGRKQVISYASGNGWSYTAIGKVLVDMHALDKQHVTMQTIRAWLTSHPKEQENVLAKNRSYIFFNKLQQTDPLGTEQVPLTACRSLAIDKQYIPLGVPIWLDTTLPDHSSFQRLLITQDTGGAIKGVIRGDVYWGEGDQAAEIAGSMQSKGRYWLLLPKN